MSINKLIGFYICDKRMSFNADFFQVGLTTMLLEYCGYYVYFWGIGDIKKYKINGKYTLSFPLNENLLDRNVLISFEDNNIIIENDWLGSIPVFYNKKEKIISTISNFCIKNKTIDHDGLANFCEFGYSVFEHTFLRDVKFLRFYSKIILNTQGDLHVEYKDDIAKEEEFLEFKSSEQVAFSVLKNYIIDIESSTKGDIVLPTSGGYDSRLLNYLIEDKSRIRSFTYGVSKKQSKSFEVVYAKKISEIFKTTWQHIEVNNFNQYINDWFGVYGMSTHLHGMYHIEFYKEIINKNKLYNPTFLSGIFGDIWAGSNKFEKIYNEDELIYLGYTHGMNLSLEKLNFKNKENPIKDLFFTQNKSYFLNERYITICVIRTKIILISYLTQIPEYFGMPVWTPFLNHNVVKNILGIDKQRRKNRAWQRDFFAKIGLNLEDMNLKFSRSNSLNYEVLKNSVFEPLNADSLEFIFDKKRIFEINSILQKTNSINHWDQSCNYLLSVPKVGSVMRRMGFENNQLRALYDYYVIKAVEKGLTYDS